MSTTRRRPLLRQAVRLALQRLALFLYPSLLTASLLVLLRRNAPLLARMPTWAVVLSGFISIPTFHIGRAKLEELIIARKAARLGAQLPPRWEGKSIGDVDVLTYMMNEFNNGFLSQYFHHQTRDALKFDCLYLGEAAWQKLRELGHTLDTYVLWDRTWITDDVNVIKVHSSTAEVGFSHISLGCPGHRLRDIC